MLDCDITVVYLHEDADTVEIGLSKYIVYLDKSFLNYEINDYLYVHVWRD